MNWNLVVIFTFVIILASVRGHFRGRGAAPVGLASPDLAALDRAMEVARRREPRGETQERVLDEDAPGWRARARA